jgi:hypothetical protein
MMLWGCMEVKRGEGWNGVKSWGEKKVDLQAEGRCKESVWHQLFN